MLSSIRKTAGAFVGGDADRSFEPVLLFSLLGLTLSLAFAGWAPA
jgi:hypothetical protein